MSIDENNEVQELIITKLKFKNICIWNEVSQSITLKFKVYIHKKKRKIGIIKYSFVFQKKEKKLF